MKGLEALPAFDKETGDLNVVIESPRGCRNKYKFDEERGIFLLGGTLTAGHSFPFDFGFIPGTLGGDGDPLDILLIMDEPAFPGCVVPSRLIGVIEAEQTEDGKTMRNDRLLGVPVKSQDHSELRSIKDLSHEMVRQIEHFFISYNEMKGKEFKPMGRFGNRKAMDLVKESLVKKRTKK